MGDKWSGQILNPVKSGILLFWRESLGKLLECRGLPDQTPVLPRWAFKPLSEFQFLQYVPNPMRV